MRGTLRDVLSSIDTFNECDVIAVAGRPPWTGDSAAAVHLMDPYSEQTVKVNDYFLEIGVARDVIANWSEFRQGGVTLDELCRVLAHYAQYDTYPNDTSGDKR
jgi:hypothetical protein